MRGKKSKTAVVEALQRAWRDGGVRQTTREQSTLDDAAIETALGDAQTAAELGRYANLMVREALLGVVQTQIARAMKDTQGAKQFFELAQMGKLLEGGPVAGDPAADMNELERSVLHGLREALEEGKGE